MLDRTSVSPHESLAGVRTTDDPPAHSLLPQAVSIGAAAALRPLIEALDHPDPWERLHAVELLGRIDDPTARAALVTALHDEVFGVRWIAAKLLAGAGHPGVVALLRALLHETLTPNFRLGAAYVLHHAAITAEERAAVEPVFLALHHPASDLEAPVLAKEALELLEREAGTGIEGTLPWWHFRRMRRPRGHIFPLPAEASV